MNRQIIYIVQGFLLFLLLPLGYFVINKIASVENLKQNQSPVIEYQEKTSVNKPQTFEYAGKKLFQVKCAACHQLFKGNPSLIGFEERGPWKDRNELYAWIRNPEEFMKKNKYARDLKATYGSVMFSFPDITNEEIDAIVDYINASRRNVY